MATTLNYNASFSGRLVIPTEDVLKGTEAWNKLVEACEAGEEMDDFNEYLSHSEDLETFTQRCLVQAVQDVIIREFIDGHFHSVGTLR